LSEEKKQQAIAFERWASRCGAEQRTYAGNGWSISARCGSRGPSARRLGTPSGKTGHISRDLRKQTRLLEEQYWSISFLCLSLATFLIEHESDLLAQPLPKAPKFLILEAHHLRKADHTQRQTHR